MFVVAGELREILNQPRLRGSLGSAEHRPRAGMGQQEMFRVNAALQGRPTKPHLSEVVAAQTQRDPGIIHAWDNFGVKDDPRPPALLLRAQCVAMQAHVTPSGRRGRGFTRKDQG